MNLNKTLKVYVGNTMLAPYEFKVSTDILGSVNSVLFGKLLNATDTQEIQKGLIDEWHFDHRNTYTLKLGSHKFHNGREITSKDLEFSIVRGFISDYPNYNQIHFSNIEGIEKLHKGMTFKHGMVTGIQVIDKKTIKIKIKNKNPVFLLNFTIPFAPLVPIEELKEDYYTWKTIPIGAGPYKVKKDHENNILTLEKNSESSGPDFIEYHTKRNNTEYDLLLKTVDQVDSENNFVSNIPKNPSAIYSMFFYRKNYLGQNLNFRKSIYYAINREEALNNSPMHKPAYLMNIRPYSSKITKNPFNQKLAIEYAKKLPEYYFKSEILIGVYSNNNEFPTVIRDQIGTLKKQLEVTGLKFKFEPIQEKFPTEEIMQKYAIKMQSKVMDLADPAISYGAMSEESPYHLEMPDSNGLFDQAYREALEADSYENRILSIDKISLIILNEALIVPIFESYARYRTNPKTIKSLGDQPKPLFIDLSLVEMY